MSTPTKLNVILTKSYRLSSDGERNFTIEQLVTVDPTKAPGWAKVAAAHLTETGTELVAEVRQEWRDTGNSFGMTAAGLANAVEFVALRQAVEDSANSGNVDLREFAEAVRSNSEDLRRAVRGLLTEVNV